jgi:FkbM family methyltransferase
MFHAPRFMFRALFLTRLARSAWKTYARAFKGPYFTERRMGAWWLLDQHNIIDRRLFCEGVWEEDQVGRLSSYARALGEDNVKPHFLDIGSHAGFYAVLMRRSGLFDRVLAFEPLNAHLDQLRANLLLNDLSHRIEVFDCALSDHAGVLHFAPGPKTNRGMAHTVDGASTGLLASTPQAEIIEVKARRLDDLLTFEGARLAIKIDVEGHEIATLAGMQRILTANQCALQVEILPEALEPVSGLLTGLGYRPLGAIGLDHYFSNATAI